MGWASGSTLFREIISIAEENVPAEHREAFYVALIRAFEGEDWDTQDECRGLSPDYDSALRKLHPDWYHP